MTLEVQQKGIIFDLKRYAIHDGPGIRTTVFLKGCPLDCRWCHNPEGKNPGVETLTIGSDDSVESSTKVIGREMTTDEVMQEVLKDRIFYEQSGGGVTFSGGEPLMQIDFLHDLVLKSKRLGLNTVLDTCGYAASEDLDRIIDYIDLFLYDLKLIDEDEHIRYTGVSNGTILENLRTLLERDKKVQIRIPLIPGITDTESRLNSMGQFLLSLDGIEDISLLSYNQFCEDKSKRFANNKKLPAMNVQKMDDLKQMASIFESNGFRVRIGG